MSHLDTPTDTFNYVTEYDREEYKTLLVRMFVRGAIAFFGLLGLLYMITVTSNAGTFGVAGATFVYITLGGAMLYIVALFQVTSGKFSPVNKSRDRVLDAYRFFGNLSDQQLHQPKRASFSMQILKDGTFMHVTLTPNDNRFRPIRYAITPTYYGTVGAGPQLDMLLPGLKSMFTNPDNFGDYNDIITGNFKPVVTTLPVK